MCAVSTKNIPATQRTLILRENALYTSTKTWTK
jgi:hypothetical protein